MIDHTIGFVA